VFQRGRFGIESRISAAAGHPCSQRKGRQEKSRQQQENHSCRRKPTAPLENVLHFGKHHVHPACARAIVVQVRERDCRRFKLVLRFVLKFNLRFVLRFNLRLILRFDLRFVLRFDLRLDLRFDLRLSLWFDLRLILRFDLKLGLRFDLRLSLWFDWRLSLRFDLRLSLWFDWRLSLWFDLRLSPWFDLRLVLEFLSFVRFYLIAHLFYLQLGVQPLKSVHKRRYSITGEGNSKDRAARVALSNVQTSEGSRIKTAKSSRSAFWKSRLLFIPQYRQS
jgi:hypothetical protein